MHPWQVSLGLTVATFIPLVVFVHSELGYLGPYWDLAWDAYAFHLVAVPSATFLLMVFGFYHVARLLFLGDVGSRIQVLDQSIREGHTGDPELAEALGREESGEYDS